MADFKALTIQNGNNTQIQDTNSLIIGAGIKTNTGSLTITPAGTSVIIASGKILTLGSGNGNVDFSPSSGTFATPTGAVTLGPGAITISGATTTSANFTIGTGSILAVSGSGMINLPNLFQINGNAVGATVIAANLTSLTNGSNADSLHTHTNVSAGSVTTSGLTTSSMTVDGYFGYLSSNNTIAKTDSATLSTSRTCGAYSGIAGSMLSTGVVATAAFTTVGGMPAAGGPVFLAAATDDSNTGAGKLTAAAPSTGIVAEVGICLDNANYSTSKTCKILLQIKAPVQL